MKKNIDVARAWRDEDYFQSLSAEERASLGDHPAGVLAIEDAVLKSITGGCAPTVDQTTVCSVCPPLWCE